MKIPGIKEVHATITNKGLLAGYKYKFEECLIFEKPYNTNIMTYHSSKGLEFNTVILPFCLALNSHSNECVNYVGMTRAKQKLVITCSGFIENELDKDISIDLFEGEKLFRLKDVMKDQGTFNNDSLKKLMDELGI